MPSGSLRPSSARLDRACDGVADDTPVPPVPPAPPRRAGRPVSSALRRLGRPDHPQLAAQGRLGRRRHVPVCRPGPLPERPGLAGHDPDRQDQPADLGRPAEQPRQRHEHPLLRADRCRRPAERLELHGDRRPVDGDAPGGDPVLDRPGPRPGRRPAGPDPRLRSTGRPGPARPAHLEERPDQGRRGNAGDRAAAPDAGPVDAARRRSRGRPRSSAWRPPRSPGS